MAGRLAGRVGDDRTSDPPLPKEVNGPWAIHNAFIAHDESYFVACIEGRKDSLTPGVANCCIFFRDEGDRGSNADIRPECSDGDPGHHKN